MPSRSGNQKDGACKATLQLQKVASFQLQVHQSHKLIIAVLSYTTYFKTRAVKNGKCF